MSTPLKINKTREIFGIHYLNLMWIQSVDLSFVAWKALFPVEAISSTSDQIRERESNFSPCKHCLPTGPSLRPDSTDHLLWITTISHLPSVMLVCLQQSWGAAGCFHLSKSHSCGPEDFHALSILARLLIWNETWKKIYLLSSVIKEPVSFLASLASCLLVGWVPRASNDGDIVSIIYSPLYIMMMLTLVEDSPSTKHLAEALHTNPINYSHEKVLLKSPFQRWGNWDGEVVAFVEIYGRYVKAQRLELRQSIIRDGTFNHDTYKSVFWMNNDMLKKIFLLEFYLLQESLTHIWNRVVPVKGWFSILFSQLRILCIHYTCENCEFFHLAVLKTLREKNRKLFSFLLFGFLLGKIQRLIPVGPGVRPPEWVTAQ